MTDTAFVMRHVRHTAPKHKGRFEYRVWPRSPLSAVSLLHRSWPLTDAERRSDIYLVHAASDQSLVKLRGGDRLEIKRRNIDVGTVQYWTMPVSAAFPLKAVRLDDLALTLSLRRDLPATAGLSAAHLIAELDVLDTTVKPQTVQKSRLIFRRGNCRAEICRVSIAGWRGLTVALEAEDIPSIAAALEELRLGTLPNLSYGKALMQFASLQMRHRTLLTPS